jgi:hypothetical protein
MRMNLTITFHIYNVLFVRIMNAEIETEIISVGHPVHPQEFQLDVTTFETSRSPATGVIFIR